ncbi:MAG: beta-N-acetylhexosaminidase [Sphingobacteriales bacterium]|nr:MAG: beta-N-acetylhexosaminidase [Sphingobacteriales bacterium]
MKKIICLLYLIQAFSVQAQVNITPQPAALTMGTGNMLINSKTAIVLQGSGLQRSADFLQNYIRSIYGLQLNIVDASNTGGYKTREATIVLNFERMDKPIPGAYNMNISEKNVYITGDNEQGVFYGIQTLIQLLPLVKSQALSIPQLSITDYPRFAYRGMHLDVSRHFFPVSFVKKYIDYLAYHKLNNFHWHLTDDQGWRIEIKKYPKLTQIGSCRDQTLVGRFGSDKYDGEKYCGFYTQDQIKEVVQYAADRYINVIPEIEMPGHAMAAIAAYPELSCTPNEPKKVAQTWGVFDDVFCPSETTFTFLQNVMDEVIQLFPSTYVHIGGDECPKTAWKNSAFCQQLMKEKGLKDEHALQSYFIQRMEKYINNKGRKIIGWDEILEGGLAPNATVMSWTGENGGIAAAKQQHDAIMTPTGWMYFDYNQTKNEDSVSIGGYIPLEKVYNYEPVPKELDASQAKYILGAQANLWSEYITNPSKVEYLLFPRLTALSEVQWTPANKKTYKDFETRLPGIFKRYELWGANYSTAYYDLQASTIQQGNNNIAWKLETNKADGKVIYVQGRNSTKQRAYASPVAVKENIELGAALTDNKGKVISKWVWQQFELNKASGKKASISPAPSKNYPGSGAFTLVDGIQNKVGMPKSAEFLGFLGKDAEAVIDLGKAEAISSITLHAFEQAGSWIYRPASVSFSTSADGITYSTPQTITNATGTKNLLYTASLKTNARFIKVTAINYGVIPVGKPGEGSKAWMFLDEIEVK